MAKRIVPPGEIGAGDVMLCEAYDSRGELLLCRGYVLGDAAQVEALVSQGLLVEGDAPASARGGVAPLLIDDEIPASTAALDPPLPSPSAVQILLDARRRLESVLDEGAGHAGFAEAVAGLAERVARACSISRDAALATALFEREGRYSIRHSLDVAVTCHAVGTAFGFADRDLASTICAALTMNFSILRLQDLLQAQEQGLSVQQQTVVRGHSEASAAMLERAGVTDPLWLAAIRAHHESVDGTGYPHGLKGDEVGIAAQLISLADVYCARVSSRRYRRGLRPQDALRAVLLDDGKRTSQELGARFIQAIGVFPAGTPVRLANREIGVVVARGVQPTQPYVCSVIASDGMPFPSPVRRDTRTAAYRIQELVDWVEVGAVPRMRALWGPVAAVR